MLSCTSQSNNSEKKESIRYSSMTAIDSLLPITPSFVTKYTLGERGFFEEAKDSQSYLPIDFIYHNHKLFFFPEKGRNFEMREGQLEYFPETNRNLIAYDLIEKQNLPNEEINMAISKVARENSYVEKMLISNDTGLVLFNNFAFLFSCKNDSLSFINSYTRKSNIRYLLPKPSVGYYCISYGSLKEIDYFGNILQENAIKNPIHETENYFYNQSLYTCMGEVLNVEASENIVHIDTIKTGLSLDEKMRIYALMGVSDKYTVWMKNALSMNPTEKINELLFFNIYTGELKWKVILDKSILNPESIDQTFYPYLGDSMDPPELRQYIRLCYGDGKYYLMFQAKKVVYIYSFSLPA